MLAYADEEAVLRLHKQVEEDIKGVVINDAKTLEVPKFSDRDNILASCGRQLACGRQARKPRISRGTFAMASVDALKKLRPVGELGKSANSTSGCMEAGHDSTSAARASIEDCLAKLVARASANLVLGAQSGPW